MASERAAEEIAQELERCALELRNGTLPAIVAAWLDNCALRVKHISEKEEQMLGINSYNVTIIDTEGRPSLTQFFDKTGAFIIAYIKKADKELRRDSKNERRALEAFVFNHGTKQVRLFDVKEDGSLRLRNIHTPTERKEEA